MNQVGWDPFKSIHDGIDYRAEHKKKMRRDLCRSLSKNSQPEFSECFYPDSEYNSGIIQSKNLLGSTTSQFRKQICKEFENAHMWKDSLIMKDFYDFFWYEYEIKKKISDYMPSIKLSVATLRKPILSKFSFPSVNFNKINFSRENIKNTVALICSLWVSVHPLHNFTYQSNLDVHEKIESYDYSSDISFILEVSREKISRSYLKTLKTDQDLDSFQTMLSSFRNDLYNLSQEKFRSGDWSKKVIALLNQYSDLIYMIDSIWKNKSDLQMVKRLIIELNMNLQKQSIRNPIENPGISTFLFWREENEIEWEKLQENSEPIKPEEPIVKL